MRAQRVAAALQGPAGVHGATGGDGELHPTMQPGSAAPLHPPSGFLGTCTGIKPPHRALMAAGQPWIRLAVLLQHRPQRGTGPGPSGPHPLVPSAAGSKGGAHFLPFSPFY